MFKVVFRALFAVLILAGFYYIYSSKLLAPYYLKHPDATSYAVPKDRVYIFPGLSGPEKKTTMPEVKSTEYKLFEQGSESRLAVLLTDDNSYWLDLIHGLKAAGIPFIVTKDYRKALKHKLVLVYPSTIGLPENETAALAEFPKQGGTLVVQGLIAKPLNGVFGLSQSKPINNVKLSTIQFNRDTALIHNFQYPEQKSLRVGDAKHRTFANAVYVKPRRAPLAVFENNQPAIIENDYQNGHAYALGLDLGRFFAIGYSRRQWGNQTISKEYVNAYEPHIDSLLQLIQNIYRQSQTNAVTLSPVPHGKKLTVIFTFDNDSAAAIASMGTYKDILAANDLKGTFFILTKYISDDDDFAFFTRKNLPFIQALVDAGMEVSSEGVSHSFDFNKFPLGNGKERYPEYQPYVMHTRGVDTHTILGEIPETITYNGSILGELRVSRFLLHHFFPELPLKSFRPGFLKNPMQLPQALVATDFHYTSATTAGDSLSHLPFQLDYNRGIDSMIQAQMPVYEFPITLEDQKGRAIDKRISEALVLAKKISSFKGLYLVLIHPDNERAKPRFLEQFIKALPSVAPVWFSSLSEFGDWWSARDQVSVDVSAEDEHLIINLNLPRAISGLTLILPKGFIYENAAPELHQVIQNDLELVIVDFISGKQVIRLKKTGI